MDIDGDQDRDLFVHEDERTLLYLENTGTPQSAAFTWKPGAFGELPVGRWMHFADLEADGDFDLLYDPGEDFIAVRRNLGSAASADFSGPELLLKDSAGSAI